MIHVKILRILTILLALSLALAAMVLVLLLRGISEESTVAIVFAALSVCSVIFSLMLFRKIKSGSSNSQLSA